MDKGCFNADSGNSHYSFTHSFKYLKKLDFAWFGLIFYLIEKRVMTQTCLNLLFWPMSNFLTEIVDQKSLFSLIFRLRIFSNWVDWRMPSSLFEKGIKTPLLIQMACLGRTSFKSIYLYFLSHIAPYHLGLVLGQNTEFDFAKLYKSNQKRYFIDKLNQIGR